MNFRVNNSFWIGFFLNFYFVRESLLEKCLVILPSRWYNVRRDWFALLNLTFMKPRRNIENYVMPFYRLGNIYKKKFKRINRR